MTGILPLVSMTAEVLVEAGQIIVAEVVALVRFATVAFNFTAGAGSHHVYCLQDLHSVFTCVHVATWHSNSLDWHSGRYLLS